MTVGEIIIHFKMTRWNKFLFWSVNLPRYFLRMPLVVYPCMVSVSPVMGFKRATIELAKD